MYNLILEKTINRLNTHYHRKENQTLCLYSAKSIGCFVEGLRTNDLEEANDTKVMDLIWQIIRNGIISRINVYDHPELKTILNNGETEDDLKKLSIENILLKWFNYHLNLSGVEKRVKNFSDDIKDSIAYINLIKQIAPPNINASMIPDESDVEKRAKTVIEISKIGCVKFIQPKDIVNGSEKLNLLFIAHLFNTHSGLKQNQNDKSSSESNEEKSYRNWINSLGVKPYVSDLMYGCSDGLIIIQLFDKVYPGIVDKTKVNYPPYNQNDQEKKKLENCNYVIQLGNQCKYSLDEIDGKQLYERNKNLTLSLIWQLYRGSLISKLINLADKKNINDSDVLDWANKKLQSGKGYQLNQGFKDSKIMTSIPIIDLCDLIRPKSVDYELVYQDNDEESYQSNAKIAISLTRRIGCNVFTYPDDN